jgi:hypothetical protein
MPDTVQCKNCKYFMKYKHNGVWYGMGQCTLLGNYALKSIDDNVRIVGTPIVWKNCTCLSGETGTPQEEQIEP